MVERTWKRPSGDPERRNRGVANAPSNMRSGGEEGKLRILKKKGKRVWSRLWDWKAPKAEYTHRCLWRRVSKVRHLKTTLGGGVEKRVEAGGGASWAGKGPSHQKRVRTQGNENTKITEKNSKTSGRRGVVETIINPTNIRAYKCEETKSEKLEGRGP